MATFTATIQELLNAKFDFGLTPEDYPIFDEKLRGYLDDNGEWQYTKVDNETGGVDFFGLNKMILDHYMYWEIGYETPDMFRFALNRKMREIMPYYNKLLSSELIEFDPLSTLDTIHATTTEENIEEVEHSVTDNTTGTDATTVSRTVNSAFPQMQLQGNEDYATAGADTNSQSHTEGTGNVVGDGTKNIGSDGTVTTHLSGTNGHAASLLMAYRRSFLNVSMMIVTEIEPLFMMVTDTFDDRFAMGNGSPFYSFGFPYFPTGI